MEKNIAYLIGSNKFLKLMSLYLKDKDYAKDIIHANHIPVGKVYGRLVRLKKYSKINHYCLTTNTVYDVARHYQKACLKALHAYFNMYLGDELTEGDIECNNGLCLGTINTLRYDPRVIHMYNDRYNTNYKTGVTLFDR